MPRYVLHFCLVSPEGLSEQAQESWYNDRNALLKQLVDNMTSLGDCEVELTRARAAELLKFLEKMRKEKARTNSPWLEEKLVDDGKGPVEWFIADPGYMGDCSGGLSWDLHKPIGEEDYPLSVKADRMKPGFHLSGWTPLVYVSEAFKAVVEKYRLTGIEFIWCRDVGKYRAAQWYLPVCHRPLGRGLDCPWIDTTKLNGRGNQTMDPRGRHGLKGAFEDQYKAGAGPDDPTLKKVLRLLKSMELLNRSPGFGSFSRFLRKHLPETDFAYTVEDWEVNDENCKQRGLAFNRKARDILSANGVVRDAQCEPVMIMNQPPKGVENLDKKYGPAEPAFTPEQTAKLRELEAKARAEHLAHPKPPRAPDLKRSLSLLRARKRQTPKDFAKPASAKAIEETAKAFSRKIPAAWQQLLLISNGGRIDKSPLAAGCACIIMPLKDLAQWQRSESKYYRGRGAELPDSMLFIIHTEIGDSIWLDTSKPKPDGDCRVVLMSHETGDEERDWPTIAEFLEELLTETQERRARGVHFSNSGPRRRTV
jgi:hypothetical protein